MKDDLLANLSSVDPVTDARVRAESRTLGDLPGRIAAGESPVEGRIRRLPRMPRRAVAIGLAAALLAIGVAVPLALLSPLGGDGISYGFVGDGWFRAGTLEDLQANEITYLPEVKIFVVAQPNAQPYALHAVATDPLGSEGGPVLYCTSSSSFFSPDHEAQYDLSGVASLGTGGTEMSGAPVRVLDGFVEVDTASSHRLPGPRVIGVTGPASDTPCDEGNGYREVRPGAVEPIPATDLAPIEVSTPEPGDVVTSPVTIAGTADVFEGTVSYQILDADGAILKQGFTTATCSIDCRGDYSVDAPFEVGQEQSGTILVFSESGEDGSMTNVVEIPVTLQPSLDPIEVSTPQSGDFVSSPVTIAGTADVTEANVRIRILDEDENMLADTYTMATCGTGCRGDYSEDVTFHVAHVQDGTIQVFEESMEDGSITKLVEISVTLLPGSGLVPSFVFAGAWFDPAGEPASDGVLTANLGPEHCSWQDIVFLELDIPGDAKGTFLRDVKSELKDYTSGPFEIVSTLPDDAIDSGYFTSKWFLWTSATDAHAVFLVNGLPSAGGTIERWPATTSGFGCA